MNLVSIYAEKRLLFVAVGENEFQVNVYDLRDIQEMTSSGPLRPIQVLNPNTHIAAKLSCNFLKISMLSSKFVLSATTDEGFICIWQIEPNSLNSSHCNVLAGITNRPIILE